MEPVTLGVLGCGNISDAYLRGAANSKLVRVKACADLVPDAARAKAQQYGIEAMAIDALLADPDIEMIVDLAVPAAHAQIGQDAIRAGKHVYSEKPLATTFAEGRALVEAAGAAGLLVGCAPDTFFGAAPQTCRRLIDEGRIGTVVAGTATMISRGMEHWHPNPGFYFKPGGGPVLDMGPYYVTQLVNLLGPVVRVTSIATKGFAQRTITSQPLNGQRIEVEVPTTINGALEFASGANVAVTMSWDIWKTRRAPIEIYGSEGSLIGPDPDIFDGEVLVSERNGDWQPVDIAPHPFGAINYTTPGGLRVANYRMVGALDMAVAIRAGRPHRASGALALHVLEVLEALNTAAERGGQVAIESRCERPAAVPQGADETVLLDGNGTLSA